MRLHDRKSMNRSNEESAFGSCDCTEWWTTSPRFASSRRASRCGMGPHDPSSIKLHAARQVEFRLWRIQTSEAGARGRRHKHTTEMRRNVRGDVRGRGGVDHVHAAWSARTNELLLSMRLQGCPARSERSAADGSRCHVISRRQRGLIRRRLQLLCSLLQGELMTQLWSGVRGCLLLWVLLCLKVVRLRCTLLVSRLSLWWCRREGAPPRGHRHGIRGGHARDTDVRRRNRGAHSGDGVVGIRR
jgi:hypothetical protein